MKTKSLLACILLLISTQAPAQVIVEETQETADSSPGSPPLETDDPGTPGPWGVEINFIANCDYIMAGRSCGLGVDANLGLGEKFQLRVQKQSIEEVRRDEATFYGLGQTAVGLKYRFYEPGTWKFAFYPSYQVADDTRHLNEDGTPEDSQGRALYLPLIFSKQIGIHTVVANLGYGMNLEDSANRSVFTSVAFGTPLADELKGMAEITSLKIPTGRTNILRLGLVKQFPGGASQPFETALFASIGRSLGPSADQQDHTVALVGFTLAKKAP